MKVGAQSWMQHLDKCMYIYLVQSMRASSAFWGVYQNFGFQDARVIRMEIGRLDMVESAQTHQH